MISDQLLKSEGKSCRQLSAIVLGMVLVLSSCASYSKVDTLGPTIAEINEMPVSEARSLISDNTVMTFQGPQSVCDGGYMLGSIYVPNCYTQPGHGTQVEYFAPNGRAFLWYPGNTRSVPSYWKIEKGTRSHLICFQYPANSYNRLTKQSGGNWECAKLGFWAKDITEIRGKDIFSLSSGRVPHSLSTYQTTFDALLKE